jgi:hypothetical protein
MRRGAVKTRSSRIPVSGADGHEERKYNSDYFENNNAKKRKVNKHNKRISNGGISNRLNNDEEEEAETSDGIVSEKESLADSSFAINNSSSNSQSDCASKQSTRARTVPSKGIKKNVNPSRNASKKKETGSSSTTGKFHKFMFQQQLIIITIHSIRTSQS